MFIFELQKVFFVGSQQRKIKRISVARKNFRKKNLIFLSFAKKNCVKKVAALLAAVSGGHFKST